MIAFDGVVKTFGERRALDGVSFEVRRGEILGLLGHNGAGKSTLFGVTLGLLRLNGGDILIDGVSVRRDARRARATVGSVLAPAFYEYLSGRENLRILASYSGRRIAPAEVDAVVRLVGLATRIDDRVRRYSHGMRRRLALAQALLPRPELLLLDEWEAGLDPEGVVEIRELVVRLNRDHGMTVVMSSHQPAAMHGMGERVAILREGRLVFLGRWADVEDGPPTFILDVDDWARASVVLATIGAHRLGGDRVVLAPVGDVADVVAALVHAGVRVRGVRPAEPSTEALVARLLARGRAVSDGGAARDADAPGGRP